jgi:hypothetical protein
MATITALKDKLASTARSQREGYASGADRPLGGYAAVVAAYTGVVGSMALAARLTRPDLPSITPWDVVLLSAAATHKLSRLLSKDPVTSPLRAPFTSYNGTSGPAELKEEARGDGGRKAVGELVTCPFCMGCGSRPGSRPGRSSCPGPPGWPWRP